jgi:hypothetical protein
VRQFSLRCAEPWKSEKDGVWVIEVVGLQGVRSVGEVNSAVDNVREAIAAAEDLDEWGDLGLVITVGDEATAGVPDRVREAKWDEESASSERAQRGSRMQSRLYEQKECLIATSVS